MKVVCTVAVAVLAAGRTGPAAPGSERADRLHLPHVRCTALPARCLRACMVHSAICHTTHVRTGFGREHRQRAFTLDEQRLHVRAVMTCLEAHHDVAIRSGLVAVHSVDRRAVNICNILLQTARLRVLTCCASCAVLDHGCLQQGAPGQRRQVTSARGCTCSMDEQRLHVRAVMTCLEAHHDVAIRSGLVAVHSVDRRAVNICNILLQTARLRVLTCCASCAVLDHGCLQQGAPGQRRQVTSARGCTCSMTVHGTASAAHM